MATWQERLAEPKKVRFVVYETWILFNSGSPTSSSIPSDDDSPTAQTVNMPAQRPSSAPASSTSSSSVFPGPGRTLGILVPTSLSSSASNGSTTCKPMQLNLHTNVQHSRLMPIPQLRRRTGPAATTNATAQSSSSNMARNPPATSSNMTTTTSTSTATANRSADAGTRVHNRHTRSDASSLNSSIQTDRRGH
ncbi:unnamed protein product [Cyclocybe aegerita]|uniref:Uncharacterized protein n=1 Tax=Cyclocybe aegerita TaxID=1973307 RepID=A0A8S0WRI8_CYCAE|nr:unnamed protein product [Cyclocybe aegerita]